MLQALDLITLHSLRIDFPYGSITTCAPGVRFMMAA